MNPTCHEISHRLISYADGELTGEEQVLVRKHLDGCDACTQKVAALRSSLRLAGEIWEANRTLRPSAARTSPRTAGSRFRGIPKPAVAAGLAAAIALIVILFPSGRTNQTVQTIEPPPSEHKIAEHKTADRSPGLPDSIRVILDRQSLRAQLLASADLMENDPDGPAQAKKRRALVAASFGQPTTQQTQDAKESSPSRS